MIKLKTLLISLLLGFTILNIFLISFLILGRFPWQKPDFKTELTAYTFKSGEIKILPGIIDGDKILSGTVSLKGIINSSPFYDKKENSYIMPVLFINSSGQKTTLKIILGNPDDNIVLVKAKRGIIANNPTEKNYKINDILVLLKKNYPLIITAFYDTNSFLTFKSKHITCKDYCKKQIKNNLLYSDNIESLLKQNSANKELLIGPLFSLVIYEK